MSTPNPFIDTDRIRNKLKKILALARQGVGGERDNAQSMLDKLLARYGMTLEDLDDRGEERTTHWFNPRSKHEQILLTHCIWVVRGPEWDRVAWKERRGPSRGYDLTNAEFAEVDLLFTIHRRALARHIKKQAEAARDAYLIKNRLFVEKEGGRDPDEELPEDLELIAGILAGMEATPVRKAVGHGGAS